MLISHSLSYLVYRGVPGLINFAALAVYTRLLTPAEFGHYALVFAAVALVDVLLFQWMRGVVLRFLPAAQKNDEPLLGYIKYMYALVSIFCLLAGLALGLGLLHSTIVLLVLASPMLLVLYSRFELMLSVATACLHPAQYGRLLLTRAVVALALGAGLAWLGFGALSPILGLVGGFTIAILLFSPGEYRQARAQRPAPEAFGQQFRYGMPWAMSLALIWVFNSSDRYMIAWFMDEESVGLYSVGSDLVLQIMGLLVAIIHTAAYPLAIRALEQGGEKAAKNQLMENGQLLSLVVLCAAAGIWVLGDDLAGLVLAGEFIQGALLILPFMLASSVVSNLKAFYLDTVFHLQSDTRILLLTTVAGAVANIALNLILIPVYGIVGAAAASMLAAILAALFSAWKGRNMLGLFEHFSVLFRPAGVALAGGAVTWVVAGFSDSRLFSIYAALAGGAAMIALAFLLDVSGIRHKFYARVGRAG